MGFSFALIICSCPFGPCVVQVDCIGLSKNSGIVFANFGGCSLCFSTLLFALCLCKLCRLQLVLLDFVGRALSLQTLSVAARVSQLCWSRFVLADFVGCTLCVAPCVLRRACLELVFFNFVGSGQEWSVN